MKRTIKIFFKDNTNTVFQVEDEWLDEATNEIKEAMILKAPYILNQYDMYSCHENTLIIPTENIKYIQILDDISKQNKKHKDED